MCIWVECVYYEYNVSNVICILTKNDPTKIIENESKKFNNEYLITKICKYIKSYKKYIKSIYIYIYI